MDGNLLGVGIIISVVAFIIGCVFFFSSDSSTTGIGVGLGLAGVFGIVLFTTCLAWNSIIKCCCRTTITGNTQFGITQNPNNPAGIQVQGDFALQTLSSPSQQRLLTTAPQLPIVRPQQPQRAVINVGGRLYELTPLSTNIASTSSYTPTITPQYPTQQSSPYNFYTTRK